MSVSRPCTECSHEVRLHDPLGACKATAFNEDPRPQIVKCDCRAALQCDECLHTQADHVGETRTCTRCKCTQATWWCVDWLPPTVPRIETATEYRDRVLADPATHNLTKKVITLAATRDPVDAYHDLTLAIDVLGRLLGENLRADYPGLYADAPPLPK